MKPLESIKPVIAYGPMGLKLLAIERHACYQNTFEHLVENPDWTLVHGICVGTGGDAEGREFGHAWLEKPLFEGLCMCYDPSHRMLVSAPTMYEVGQIKYTVRYNLRKAGKLFLRHNHFGPWDAKIQAAAHR